MPTLQWRSVPIQEIATCPDLRLDAAHYVGGHTPHKTAARKPRKPL